VRDKVQYSAFAKVNGEWKRLSPLHASLTQARRIFQTALLNLSCRGYEGRLRRVEGWGTESEEEYEATWNTLKGETGFSN
jgi:hypothetical protein